MSLIWLIHCQLHWYEDLRCPVPPGLTRAPMATPPMETYTPYTPYPSPTTGESTTTEMMNNTSILPSETQEADTGGFPWWAYLLIAVVLLGIVGGSLAMWLGSGSNSNPSRRSTMGSKISRVRSVRSNRGIIRRPVSARSGSGLSSLPTTRSRNLSVSRSTRTGPSRMRA